MAISQDNSLTFEELSTVYRIENNSKLLSNVRRDFYPAIATLLAELKARYEEELAKDPESLPCEGANQHRKKGVTLSKKIAELRMSKICSLALRGAMGANNVIDMLTPEEKEYYNGVFELSKRQISSVTRNGRGRTETLDRIPGQIVKKPEPIPEPKVVVTEPIVETPMPEESCDDDLFGPEPEEENFFEEPVKVATYSPKIPEPTPTETIPVPGPVSEYVPDTETDDMVTIRILEDLPTFSGPDRNYELSKEDIVRMPTLMASALIDREKAVLLDIKP